MEANSQDSNEVETPPRGQRPATPHLAWTLSNFGVVVVVVPVFTAVLRILAVSNGDVAALYALTANLDLRSAVFGSLVPLLPGLLLFAALLLVIDWPEKVVEHAGSPNGRLYILMCAILVIPLLLYTPLTVAAISTALFPVLFYKIWRVRRGHIPRFGLTFSGWLLTVTLGLMGALLSDKTYWLPQEMIRSNDGTLHHSYVLKNEDGNLLVLEVDSVRVLWIEAQDVASRQVCSPKKWLGGRSAASLMFAADKRTPMCP